MMMDVDAVRLCLGRRFQWHEPGSHSGGSADRLGEKATPT
jgi:hypothetical protein